MSTPAIPAAKYLKRTNKRVRPKRAWNTTLKQLVEVRSRMSLFSDRGYKPTAVTKGVVCPVAPGAQKQAFIGSKIPFELTTSGNNIFELNVHELHYADRARNALTARVALHMIGGTVMELQTSAKLTAQVLAVQAWPIRAPHLTQFALGNARAAQDVIADIASSLIFLLACPSVPQQSRPTAITLVVLPYHSQDRKWVCPSCGKMFDSAIDLARHDQVMLAPNKEPRIMLTNGRLGHRFRPPPAFTGKHAWKKLALKNIEEGNVDKAMQAAPTMLQKSLADELRYKLAKLMPPQNHPAYLSASEATAN